MATHSSALAWRIPGTGSVVGCGLWGRTELDMTEVTQQQHQQQHVDDTTLTVESEEELKSLLMKVKEKSEKAGLKPNIQKTKIMASGPITSRQIDGETMETVKDYFLGLQNHCRWRLQP